MSLLEGTSADAAARADDGTIPIAAATDSEKPQSTPLLLELSTAAHFESYDRLLASILTLAFCGSRRNNEDQDHQPFSSPSLRTGKRKIDSTTSVVADVTSSTRAINDIDTTTQFLPTELAERVAQFLVITKVNMADVTAIGCSSQQLGPDNKPLVPLSECLKDTEATWWISHDGLNVAPQYVEFALVPPKTTAATTAATTTATATAMSSNAQVSACRLQSVSLSIPPLPIGPLSVRDFRLESCLLGTIVANDAGATSTTTAATSNNNTQWRAITPTLTTANRTGWQDFAITPPADVSRVRIVCLTNQMGGLNVLPVNRPMPQYAQVGFYAIRFE